MLEYNNIAIFGYSGHSYVVIDTCLSNNLEILGYFENSKVDYNPYNLQFLGNEKEFDFNTLNKNTICFPALGNNNVRKNLIELFEKNILNQVVLQHTNTIVSKSAKIGYSTLISAGAVINPLAVIGKGCIINTSSIIEHECKIGNFSHIAPGAVLAGNVEIGTCSFIGANSVIKQGVKIGDNVIIGAGSVVLKDIPDNNIFAGNPAKKIK